MLHIISLQAFISYSIWPLCPKMTLRWCLVFYVHWNQWNESIKVWSHDFWGRMSKSFCHWFSTTMHQLSEDEESTCTSIYIIKESSSHPQWVYLDNVCIFKLGQKKNTCVSGFPTLPSPDPNILLWIVSKILSNLLKNREKLLKNAIPI